MTMSIPADEPREVEPVEQTLPEGETAEAAPASDAAGE